MPPPKDPIKNAEWRKRKSEAVKAYFAIPENREKASKATKEAMARPEVKRHASIVQKQAQSRPDVRAKRSTSLKKTYAETDLRERVSKATKEAMVEVNSRPEWKEAISQSQKKYWSDPENRKRQIETMRASGQTPEAIANWHLAMEKLRSTPEYREAVAAGIAASKKFSCTDIEIIVETLLKALEIEYEPQKHIGWWVVDFYVLSKNLIIECDGDYWHSKPDVQARDVRKDAYFVRKGYQVLRLLGSQILTGELEALEKALGQE